MAHKVSVEEVPMFDLGKPDLIFKVQHNGRAFGRLKVSKGRVEWMERDDKSKAFEMTWERLGEFFPKYGRKTKTRS